ncbi:unnamed protein product [Discula destructiva]
MPSLIRLLLILAHTVVVAAQAVSYFGPYFSTGATASGVFIKQATATLVLPESSANNHGYLALWVGMGTTNGDLIQSIAACYECTDTTWQAFTYTLMKTSPTTQEPIQDVVHPASSTDHLTMLYKYDPSTKNYTQTLSLNGAVVSELSTGDGLATGWGSAVECAGNKNCGTVNAHQWIDAQIILSEPDPKYGKTLALSGGAKGSMSTSDGGITWDIGTFNIPAFTF